MKAAMTPQHSLSDLEMSINECCHASSLGDGSGRQQTYFGQSHEYERRVARSAENLAVFRVRHDRNVVDNSTPNEATPSNSCDEQ
jgi:hypothetical protein